MSYLQSAVHSLNAFVHQQCNDLFHTRAPGQLYPCVRHFYKVYRNGSPDVFGKGMSQTFHALTGVTPYPHTMARTEGQVDTSRRTTDYVDCTAICKSKCHHYSQIDMMTFLSLISPTYK